MTSIPHEFQRLSRIFERLGFPLKTAPPASDVKIDSIEEITGIAVDDDLKQLWRISNGSQRCDWFADGEVEDFSPHEFQSIQQVLSGWNLFAPYDEALYAQWYDDESWGERDPRIQRHLLRHSKWLAVTDCYGGHQQLHFDADPTELGIYGQMILFSHDPDRIDWSDNNFLSFFRRSNDLLEELAGDPELLIERLNLDA